MDGHVKPSGSPRDAVPPHFFKEILSCVGTSVLASTESALIRVFNDILQTNDAGDYVVLVLLDLSAAFDTVDHKILIAQLQHVVVHFWHCLGLVRILFSGLISVCKLYWL